MAYRAYHHRVQRRRLIDYFLPLFLFIAFAVIVILSLQLYHSIVTKHEPMDVFLFTPQGKSRILPFGTYDWNVAYDNTRVLQGDEINALPGGRASIRFFQKFWLRIDQNTTTVLQKVAPTKSLDSYEIQMKSGKAWYNTEAYTDIGVQLSILTTNLRISSTGGVFEVEDTSSDKGAEIVRTLKGTVHVAVLVSDGEKQREVESVDVAPGQEFSMDTVDYQAYQKYQSPEVLEPIPDTFVSDEWYLWNSKLDNELGI